MEYNLIELADKYETKSFLDKDPSQFMHRFTDYSKYTVADVEIVAFIAANLAFGRRDQILSHVELIIKNMEDLNQTPSQWIVNRFWEKMFPWSDKSFYRMYSYSSMRLFFESLEKLISEEKTLGGYFEKKWNIEKEKNGKSRIFLHSIIAQAFPSECSLISHGKNSAAKKLNMLLRWLVRNNSPVDLGVWKWYDKNDLLMPLDTHVMQEAVRFGFIKKTAAGTIPGANLKTALQLTDKMKEYFADDPVRGDFALFGLGTDHPAKNPD